MGRAGRRRDYLAGRRLNTFGRRFLAVNMAVAAWLQVSPVIFLLLGAQPFPLSFLGAGPAPVFAADRSKWHIPMPSVSVGVAAEPGGGKRWGYGGPRGPGRFLESQVPKVSGIPRASV